MTATMKITFTVSMLMVTTILTSLIWSMYLVMVVEVTWKERVSDWAVEYGEDFVFCDNDDEYWHIDLAYYCEHEDCYISQRGIDDKTYFISDWDSECYP